MASVTSYFSDLPDPRGSNACHELGDILFIALCAVLCGAEDCSDMALFGQSKEPCLRRLLTLPHGIPNHDTFSRVFRYLDPDSFHERFLTFLSRFAEQVEARLFTRVLIGRPECSGWRHRLSEPASSAPVVVE